MSVINEGDWVLYNNRSLGVVESMRDGGPSLVYQVRFVARDTMLVTKKDINKVDPPLLRKVLFYIGLK